jgi:hypothetical protein
MMPLLAVLAPQHCYKSFVLSTKVKNLNREMCGLSTGREGPFEEEERTVFF